MTLEEVIKSIPFDVTTATCEGREEFLSAMDKHLAIAAVKAEAIGVEELTDALDVYRKYFGAWVNGELPPEQKAIFDDASHTMTKYIDKIRFPEFEDDED